MPTTGNTCRTTDASPALWQPERRSDSATALTPAEEHVAATCPGTADLVAATILENGLLAAGARLGVARHPAMSRWKDSHGMPRLRNSASRWIEDRRLLVLDTRPLIRLTTCGSRSHCQHASPTQACTRTRLVRVPLGHRQGTSGDRPDTLPRLHGHPCIGISCKEDT